jgi:hypothetical protein
MCYGPKIVRNISATRVPLAKQSFRAIASAMTYRHFGKSGLQLNELSFVAWVTFAQQIDNKTAEKLTRIAYDSGVNFFGNAEAYANFHNTRSPSGDLI